METATVVPSCATWLPANHIPIENVVEEGASLEALAEGAVRRPFSLQQIKEQLHALLYRPDISAKACAYFSVDESDKLKEISTGHRKRKGGTLRDQYISRLKRFQRDFYSSTNLAFLTECNLGNCTTNGDDCHVQGTQHNRTQVDPFILQETNFNILQQDFPQVLTDLAATNGVSNGGDTLNPEGPDPLVNKQISETANSNLPISVQGSVSDEMPQFQLNNDECNDIIPGNLRANSIVTSRILLSSGELSNTNPYTMGCSPLLPDTDDSKSKRVEKQSGGSFTYGTSISVGDFVDLPEPSAFLEDDMLFMDADGIDLVHKSCFGSIPSVLPMDMDDIDTYKAEEKALMVVNAAFATVIGEEKHVPHVKVEKSSTSGLNNKPLKHSEGKMYCILNAEDSDVPCNDDIFLLSEGKIYRVLNTEDSDVPCNDDIFLLSEGTKYCVLNTEDSDIPCNDDIFLLSEGKIYCVLNTENSDVPCNDDIFLLSEGKIYCVLNTEDSDVPCNDDNFLRIHPDAMISITDNAMDHVFIAERNSAQGLNSVKKSEELTLTPMPPLISITKSAMDRVSVIERNSAHGLNLVKKSEEHALSPMPSLISSTRSAMDRVYVIERSSVQGLNSVKKSEELAPSLISDTKSVMDCVSVIERNSVQELYPVKKSEEFTGSPMPSLISSTRSAMDHVSVIERNGVEGLNSIKQSEELALSPMPSLISDIKRVMDIGRNSVQELNSVKKSEELTESPMPSLISITETAMDNASIKESTTIQGHLVKESEELAKFSKPSLTLGSYLLPKMDQVPTSGGTTVRVSSNDICKDLVPEHNTVAHLTQCKPSETSLASVPKAHLDNDFEKIDSGALDAAVILKELLVHTESGCAEKTDPELVANPSTSDHEGPESEIDDALFPDIEAMILDMDLGSYDDDLCFKRQVSRYQQENSKRDITRLEQRARASIQRALTPRGALAVLYGCRSRHFIRKKEVVLGRSTEERTVDIDLGSEGCHNKISRYQAIVRMKDDGSFLLKNLAKNPILVNGAEVGTGELIGLGSGSLIEIRGISFVFEPTPKNANHYLKNTQKEKQEQMAKFEWLPMEDGAMS